MKKKLPLIVIGLVVVLAVVAVGITKIRSNSQPTPPEETKKKKVLEPVNVIPVEERPYLQLIPSTDGKNLQIIVQALQKPAQEVEYEVEYQTGSQIQGFQNSIDLASLPASDIQLLGSCSAGGACTYHTDIQGGKITSRFLGPDNYALKSDWRFLDNQQRENQIGSKDAKFQLEADNLKLQRYLIVFNTAGYPGDLEFTPVSDPYSLTASGNLSGQGTLTIRANEEGDLAIMGYDGKSWTEFDSTVDGKEVTAQVELVELYLVVKK